ncbi:oligosaccharide flippase family protein [Brevibacillus daliensis]|uniref:oligosaccharide flippase family protein n=1 Tax=Brevibacillus daliensis TaxID=2892995 RepID=UPI001E4A11FF|nr:oligosaccharide flippase family protein [Brevibacillus daliensis]
MDVRSIPKDFLTGFKESRLVRNVSWSLIGNIVYACSQWGVLIVISKLGSTAMLGEFAIGLAISAPVFMFLNFQLRAILASDANDQFRVNQYVGLRIFSNVLAIIFLFVIVSMLSYSLEQKLIILLITVSKAIESFSDITYGILQKSEKMKQIAISLMLRGMSMIMIVLLTLYVTESLMLAMIGQCMAWLGVFIFYDRKNAKKIDKLQPVIDKSQLWQLLKTGLPMGITALLLSLNTNIPRYFIEHFQGAYGLGIYIAIESIIAVPQTLSDALAQSTLPQMSKSYAKKDMFAFRSLLRKLMIIGVVMGIVQILVAAVAGSFILRLMYNPDYAHYSILFIGFMILSAMLNFQTFLNMSINSVRIFQLQLPINLAKLLIIVILSVLLINDFGITGALIALIMSAVFSVVAFTIILLQRIRQVPKEG